MTSSGLTKDIEAPPPIEVELIHPDMADRPHTSNPCRNRHTDVVVQRPFTLLDPGGVGLHAVVAGVDLVHALCRKLNFLHQSRGEKDWRDATEADHTAYHYWRRLDPRGPRV